MINRRAKTNTRDKNIEKERNYKEKESDGNIVFFFWEDRKWRGELTQRERDKERRDKERREEWKERTLVSFICVKL